MSATCHTPLLPELGVHNIDVFKFVWCAAFLYSASASEVLSASTSHVTEQVAHLQNQCWHTLWDGNKFDVRDTDATLLVP